MTCVERTQPTLGWFLPVDLDCFEPGPRDRAEMTEENIARLLASDGVHAVRHEGRTLGIIGYHEAGMGEVQIWLLLSDELRRDWWRLLYRKSREILHGYILKRPDVARVVATVDPGWPAARRWLRHLGFREESRSAEAIRCVCS